jgi:hypothetical protein
MPATQTALLRWRATCLSSLLRYLHKKSSGQKVLRDKHVLFLIEQSRPMIPGLSMCEPSMERFDVQDERLRVRHS